MGGDPECAWFFLQFFDSFSGRSRPTLDPRSVRHLFARPEACKKTIKKPYENGAKTVLGAQVPFGLILMCSQETQDGSYIQDTYHKILFKSPGEGGEVVVERSFPSSFLIVFEYIFYRIQAYFFVVFYFWEVLRNTQKTVKKRCHSFFGH